MTMSKKDTSFNVSASDLRVVAWPARKNARHNPYQKLLYDAVEQVGAGRVQEFCLKTVLAHPRPDVLHIHWPDGFLAAGEGWKFWPRYVVLRSYLVIMRLRGTRLIWTAHNLRRDGQRNSNRLNRLFWPWFLKQLDGVIYMTEASASQARSSEPDLAQTPFSIIPHGHYQPILPPAPEERVIRGVPEAVFFGSITCYKNVHRLLECYLALPEDAARLHICGKFSDREPDKQLEQALCDLQPEQAKGVKVDNRFLSDEELAAAIRGADLAVFPYSNVLNSGAAIFALSVGRPILASDNSLFRELQELVGSDWVILIEGDLSPSQLFEGLCRARALLESGVEPDLNALDWKRIGADTLAFYASFLIGESVGANAGASS